MADKVSDYTSKLTCRTEIVRTRGNGGYMASRNSSPWEEKQCLLDTCISEKSLAISEALPDKWSEFSDYIEETQSKIFSLISSIDRINTETFYSSTLTDEEVRMFLRDDLVKLQALGFEVVLPAWLKAVKDTKMRVKTVAKTANSYKTTAGLNEILQFNWSFSLNGQEISADEFQQMVTENRSFIQAGNEWFRIDSAWMHEVRELIRKSEDENWTVKELLFREIPEELALALDDDEETDVDPLFAFEMQKSLQTIMTQLSEKKDFLQWKSLLTY